MSGANPAPRSWKVDSKEDIPDIKDQIGHFSLKAEQSPHFREIIDSLSVVAFSREDPAKTIYDRVGPMDET